MKTERKFKIGDVISYNDTLDSWKGKVRGYGVVECDKGVMSVYLIEGKYWDSSKQKFDKIEWFEQNERFADEWGELLTNS